MDEDTLKIRINRVIRMLDNRDMSVSSEQWMCYCREALEYLIDEIECPTPPGVVDIGTVIDETMARLARVAERRRRAV